MSQVCVVPTAPDCFLFALLAWPYTFEFAILDKGEEFKKRFLLSSFGVKANMWEFALKESAGGRAGAVSSVGNMFGRSQLCIRGREAVPKF